MTASAPPSTTTSNDDRSRRHNTRILNGTLTLHGGRNNGGIDDTEAFCKPYLARAPQDLTTHEREDLLAYLVEATWELSLRYRPGPQTFSTYAGNRLPSKVIDWLRTARQDRRYPSNTRYTLHPLNDQLAHTHTTRPLDDHTHSRADQQRLHHNRNSTHDRPYPDMDRTPTPTTTR